MAAATLRTSFPSGDCTKVYPLLRVSSGPKTRRRSAAACIRKEAVAVFQAIAAAYDKSSTDIAAEIYPRAVREHGDLDVVLFERTHLETSK